MNNQRDVGVWLWQHTNPSHAEILPAAVLKHQTCRERRKCFRWTLCFCQNCRTKLKSNICKPGRNIPSASSFTRRFLQRSSRHVFPNLLTCGNVLIMKSRDLMWLARFNWISIGRDNIELSAVPPFHLLFMLISLFGQIHQDIYNFAALEMFVLFANNSRKQNKFMPNSYSNMCILSELARPGFSGSPPITAYWTCLLARLFNNLRRCGKTY